MPNPKVFIHGIPAAVVLQQLQRQAPVRAARAFVVKCKKRLAIWRFQFWFHGVHAVLDATAHGLLHLAERARGRALRARRQYDPAWAADCEPHNVAAQLAYDRLAKMRWNRVVLGWSGKTGLMSTEDGDMPTVSAPYDGRMVE